MKRTLHELPPRWLIALLTLGLLTAAATLQGAAITWAPAADITGDSDVLNSGSLVYAYTWSGLTSTVNSVSFTGSGRTNSWNDVLAPAFTNYGPAYFTSKATPFSGLSASYSNILIGADYVVRLPVPVTLENLTIGHNYTVQVWVNDPRGPENARSETITSAGGNTNTLRFSINFTNTNPGGPGQYTIGKFTADATNQTFTLNGATGGVAQLNALQLRDETGFIKAGQTWTFGFQSLALSANQVPYNPSIAQNGSVQFNLALGGPATVTVDLFENSLSDPPLTSNLTVTANQGSLNVPTTGIWGDHQGWARLHVDTGEVKVDSVLISRYAYGMPFMSYYTSWFPTQQPVLSSGLLTNFSGILHFTLHWEWPASVFFWPVPSCTLQSSLTGGSGSWSDVTNVAGNSFTVDAVGPQRFYRLINTNFSMTLQFMRTYGSKAPLSYACH